MSKNDKEIDINNKKPAKKLVEVDDSDDDVEIVKVNKNDEQSAIDGKKIDVNEQDIPKKKKTMPLKSDIFKKEQKEILDRFHKITKFDGKMAMFYADDISDDDRKIISDSAEDIKKFFTSPSWKCVSNDDPDKLWLLLIKSLYKSTGHKVTQFADKKVENKILTRKIRIIIEKETVR